MSERFDNSREATKITLDKVKSWEDLNAITLAEANRKFSEETKNLWIDFTVHGILVFDKKEGKQVLKPSTDLDGKCALGILREAGIDTSNLTYVRPGEYKKGAINVDTGDKLGVVYDEPSSTAYFDHHASGTKEITSATEIIYKTMVDLGIVEKSQILDRVVDFVTKMDNRQFPAEEFLRSAKTVLGLQRDLDFDKLLVYFKDYQSPTEELTPEQFEKYGLKESAEKQQEVIDEAMKTLEKMIQDNKVIDTMYGKILINENNELTIGAPAAYVKFDGIINFRPDISFAVLLKENKFDEALIKKRLGDRFQGKIIREKMWIYNDSEPLKLTLEEIIAALQPELSEKNTTERESEHVIKTDTLSPETKSDEYFEISNDKEQLAGVISNFRQEANDIAIGLLFSGDRFTCIDEGIILKKDQDTIGLSTIAPKGENNSGEPTILGMYIKSEYRGKGYGTQILERAIKRCIERGFQKIRVDTLSARARKTIAKLPKEIRQKLDVHNLGDVLD